MTCVKLDEISIRSEYRVSRKNSSKELNDSVNRHGLLQPLVLIRQYPELIIVSGHNRIGALREAGILETFCIIKDSFDPEWFYRETLGKIYRKSAGTIGKLRAMILLEPFYDGTKLKQDLQIPVHITSKIAVEMLALPDAMLDYADEKDMPFKLAGRILLHSKGCGRIIEKLINCNPSLSMFRSCMELIEDIVLDKHLLENLFASSENIISMAAIDEIHSYLKHLRYPNIENDFRKYEMIKNEFKKHCIDLQIPLYYEGGKAHMIIELRKSDIVSNVRRAAVFLEKRGLDEIIGLL